MKHSSFVDQFTEKELHSERDLILDYLYAVYGEDDTGVSLQMIVDAVELPNVRAHELLLELYKLGYVSYSRQAWSLTRKGFMAH